MIRWSGGSSTSYIELELPRFVRPELPESEESRRSASMPILPDSLSGLPSMPRMDMPLEGIPDLKIQPVGAQADQAGMGFFMTSVPLIRVEPHYPGIAVREQLGGYVDLIFDIDSEGRPVNIRVWRSDPPEIFEQAAIEGFQRWRYMPMQVDGIRRASRDHTIRIQFAKPAGESS